MPFEEVLDAAEVVSEVLGREGGLQLVQLDPSVLQRPVVRPLIGCLPQAPAPLVGAPAQLCPLRLQPGQVAGNVFRRIVLPRYEAAAILGDNAGSPTQSLQLLRLLGVSGLQTLQLSTLVSFYSTGVPPLV